MATKRHQQQQHHQRQQQQQTPLQQSPIGARRVRTDLKTSENIFLTTAKPRTPLTTRTSSPITIKGTAICGNTQQVHLAPPPPPPTAQTLHATHKSHLPHAVTHQTLKSSRRTSATAVAAATPRATATPAVATKAAAKFGAVCKCWCHCAAATVLSTSAPHANATYLSAHLPARATRLLNRSRLQQQQYPSSSASGAGISASIGGISGGGGGGADSDSSKSTHSLRRSAATSRASNASTSSTNASQPPSSQYQQHHYHHHHHQKPFQHHYSQLHRDSHSSSDDLMLYDKSFRNAMIQDVLQFKKQLLRLRRILQDDEEHLMRTETLNPFDSDNGQLFAACGLDSKLLDDMDLASLTTSTTDDPLVELADLRRQVVYLQGEVEDRERTIRLQKNQIENLESKKPPINNENTKELLNIATQTERTRPFSYGPEGLSSVSTRYINRQLQLACDYKQKIVQFLNYLKTKIPTKQNFASRQILITSVPSAATAAAQRFFIIMPRKLQHFKDNFGGIVIGCLNGFVVVPQRSVGNEDGASSATVAATYGGDASLIGGIRSSPTSCLSRIASTLQRLAAFAYGTLLRFTRSCADLHSWRCLVANCRQLSCNILTCNNSNYSNSNMHHYYRGLVAYSHESANWLNLRVRNVSDLLATNIFCFFHYLQRILPSKPEYTSYTTRYHPVACCDNNSICNCANKSNNNNNNNSLCTQQQTHTCCSCNGSNNNLPASATEASAAQQQQIRRHTIISTTLSNYNQQLALAPRRASIAWEKPTATSAATTPTLTQQSSAASTHAPPPTSAAATVNHIYKPVKITLIGEPLKQWQWNAVGNGKTITESNGNGKCEVGNGVKNRKNVSSSNSNGSSVNGGGRGSDDRNEGICNGHSNGVAKAVGSGVSNGYTNGNSSKANGCNGNTSVGVVGNGKQKTVSSEPNQNHHFSNNWQQQQTHVQLSNKNAYIQQHQQQKKPLQVYQPTNGSSNGNFNPTVTIV